MQRPAGASRPKSWRMLASGSSRLKGGEITRYAEIGPMLVPSTSRTRLADDASRNSVQARSGLGLSPLPSTLEHSAFSTGMKIAFPLGTTQLSRTAVPETLNTPARKKT